jgi:hypothetical protein
MSNVVEGKVAFSHVTEHDSYMGQTTGKYSLTITLDPDAAEDLANKGIRVKEYEGNGQRKFQSKFDVEVMDKEGFPFSGEIPRGSVVRVLYALGQDHPQWGVSTYLNKVKVLEAADMASEVPEEF